ASSASRTSTPSSASHPSEGVRRERAAWIEFPTGRMHEAAGGVVGSPARDPLRRSMSTTPEALQALCDVEVSARGLFVRPALARVRGATSRGSVYWRRKRRALEKWH